MSLSNYDIVYACSELFSIYIIYYFFQSLFGVQIRNKAITISVYALYFVLTIGIHFVANIPFLNLIFTIISLFSISLCYNTTFPKRFLAIFEYIVLAFAVELIVSVVTKNAYIEPLQKYEYENEIGIFLSRMVIFWVVLLLGYFSHHRNKQKILPIWTMFVSPCIPILTIGVELLFTTVSGVTAQSVTVSMILLFIINIVVFFLYESLSIAYARAAKATAAEQEKNYYQNQCQLMQNAVEDTRRFHHDISNHFSIVEAFLEEFGLLHIENLKWFRDVDFNPLEAIGINLDAEYFENLLDEYDINTTTYQAELIEYAEPTEVLLWINGKLKFKQHSLLEITNIMEKLYDLKFVYDDESLKVERFTGEFSTDNLPDEILNVLMHTNHFSYKKEGRIIRLSKK